MLCGGSLETGKARAHDIAMIDLEAQSLAGPEVHEVIGVFSILQIPRTANGGYCSGRVHRDAIRKTEFFNSRGYGNALHISS